MFLIGSLILITLTPLVMKTCLVGVLFCLSASDYYALFRLLC